MSVAAEHEDEPHRLRVHQSAPGNCYRVTIDGQEVRPVNMRVEFDQAAKYAVAVMRLPVIVENIEAIAVLDISLGDDGDADHFEEC